MIQSHLITFNELLIEKIIQEEVKKQVEKAAYTLRFVDAKKISELCCLSVRYLEEEVFCDPRMRAIMIQKNRKRLWRADKVFDVIEEILSE